MFTKSTTDISVHQKLSDNPNIDDGLTAEQLKERFDFPAETLQEDLNNHIDELGEETAAGNIGASAISEGDTSDNNIQAKLEHLQEEIEGVSQGTVADNSITENKLTTAFNATLAKKDGTLQTGLNSEKLGGYNLQRVLNYVKPVIGSYTGDGVSSGKEINLGFTPSAVIVLSSEALTNYSGFAKYFGCAFTDTPYTYNDTNYIECVENGFKVKGSGGYASTGGVFNANNKKYNYIAFK